MSETSETKLEDQLEEDWKASDPKATTLKTGVKKHTLDSDEEDEDEGKKYEIMEDDDIEGQEDGVAGFDGDVQITPFNMKEEMEEGHFDTEGNYHWKKEGKLIRDNWLENIDWVEIKRKDTETSQDNGSDSDSDADKAPFDQVPHYRKMLTMMKPGETVAKALQRLGGKKGMSVSERWRRKKAGEQENSDGDREQVTDLTACANTVLTETGNMDIYQETYEHILRLVEGADKKHAAAHPAPKNYADALDMYADDFDEKEKARLSNKKHKTKDDTAKCSSSPNKRSKIDAKSEPGESSGEKPNPEKKHKLEESELDESSAKRLKGDVDSENVLDKTKKEEEESATLDPDSDVQWEFKWKKDSAQVEGPHPSKQMHAWVEEGHFKEPVWVRKVGQDGPFYSSSRVDFELYF